MSGSGPGRSLVAAAATDVLLAGHDLLDVIDDPLARRDAVDRLITVAENGIAGLAAFSVQRFQSFDASGSLSEREEAAEDVLVTALGEVTIAQTLLGASAATGELGPIDSAPLVASLAAAASVPAVLDADGAADPSVTVEPTPVLQVAVDGLRTQVTVTLDAIIARLVRVATGSFTALLDIAPAAVKDALATLGERVQLGKIASRLFRAALWAFDQCLAALGRIIPMPSLSPIRTKVQRLYERLGVEGAIDVGVSETLGVPRVRDYVEAALDRGGLQADRLVAARAELVALTAHHERVMRVLDGIATGIALVTATLVLAQVVVPQLALLGASAHVLVAATAVVVGIDYVDAVPGPRFVKGVQTVLREAVE